MSLHGLINSSDTFSNSLLRRQLRSINSLQNEGNGSVMVTDSEKEMMRGKVLLLPVNLSTGHFFFVWLDGDTRRKRQCCWPKSLHYSLFSHLAQSPGSIWTPLRHTIYYSSPIQGSQQKNVIVCACLTLSPVASLLVINSVRQIWHHTWRCNVTRETISSGVTCQISDRTV